MPTKHVCQFRRRKTSAHAAGAFDNDSVYAVRNMGTGYMLGRRKVKTSRISRISGLSRISRRQAIKKRAQMEIMGLAVVVVLISIGMFFVVSFTMRGDQNKIRRENFATKHVSTKFLVAYKDTMVGGCQFSTTRVYDFEDLLFDCATYKSIRCGATGSCDLLQQETAVLLEKTIKLRYEDYLFRIRIEGQPIPGVSDIISGECTEDDTGDESSLQLPIFDSGRLRVATLRLKLCT